MRIAIMQPYFLPYIGYFQLINAVDLFVVYDNIEFSKKGWINRNRILVNGKDEFITLPLKKDSDYLHINQRYLAATFEQDKQKILRKIKECYRKAPFFQETFDLIEEIVGFNSANLFEFIFNSIKLICNHLNITTEFVLSSKIDINHDLKSDHKILAICNFFNANFYVNSIGGVELYSRDFFLTANIDLKFLRSLDFKYDQLTTDFFPNLSVLDTLMFVEKLTVKSLLKNYTLL